MGPTQPPVKWVPRVEVGVKLTTRFHLMPRLRISGANFHSPILRCMDYLPHRLEHMVSGT
jgi:hypothetical protein